jgi:DNA polymerase-3 subunit delta'
VLFPSVGDSSKTWLEEYIARRQQLAAEPYAPIVYEKSRQILVGLTREVHERLQESSFEGGRKVCVVLQADRMNPSSSNTLLKILEEPPAGVHFILTTERLSSMLPTISSRASVVRFRRLRDDEIAVYLETRHGMDPETSRSYAAMAEGSLKTAKALAFVNKAEVRTRAFELYRVVALGKQRQVISHAFPFLRSRDVEEAEDLIGGFAHCTRSVLDAKYGLKKHTDAFSGTAAQLSQSTDVRALRELSVKLEEGIEMLGRNVAISTVMTSLLYGIHDAYRH